MMTLYAATGTGSVAPQVMLKLADAEHDIVWLDYKAGEHKSPEFMAINPRGQLPALKLADGTVLTESAAIILHIADCFPDAGFIAAPGTSERAQTYRWITFLATNSYEDFLRFRYPANYTTDPAGEDAISEAGVQAMERSWGLVNDALKDRPTLGSENVGAADIYMAMLMSWHRDQAGLAERYPALRAAFDHTLSNPVTLEIFEQNASI